MKKYKTDCPKCSGTGKIDLSIDLSELFDQINAAGGDVSARMIYNTFKGITRSAANNRLERLRQTGLVTRYRRGREYFYEVSLTKETRRKKDALQPLP